MLCSTQQNLIFQHYYQSYRNYLLSLGRMNEEQAVFELLILSDFKKWSSTALKALNNYTIIMTNNTNNSDKIRLSWVWCLWVFSVAYFWVNSTGCSGEFLIVFKHFQNLQNLVLNIWRKNCISLALWALVSLKPYIKKTIKKQTGSAWNFLQTPIQVCKGAYIPYFKINGPILLLSLFQRISQPSRLDQQNSKRKYCRLPPSSFRINVKDTSSHTSMDS